MEEESSVVGVDIFAIIFFMELESVPPFVYKTYQLVSDKNTDNIVSWNAYGTSLLIWNMEQFESVILPQYFKHNNFSSFVRQLNIYDFHKITNPKSNALEYSHHYFCRDSPQNLKHIQRKKPGGSKKSRNKTKKIVPYIPTASVEVPTKAEIDRFSIPGRQPGSIDSIPREQRSQSVPQLPKSISIREQIGQNIPPVYAVTPSASSDNEQLQALLKELFEHQRKTEETIYSLCTEWMHKGK